MRSPKIGQADFRRRRGVFEMAAAAGLTIAGFFAVLCDPRPGSGARRGCGVG